MEEHRGILWEEKETEVIAVHSATHILPQSVTHSNVRGINPILKLQLQTPCLSEEFVFQSDLMEAAAYQRRLPDRPGSLLEVLNCCCSSAGL